MVSRTLNRIPLRNGQHEIHRRTGRRHKGHIAPGVAQASRSHGNGFRPTEQESSRHQQAEQGNDNGAERVDVDEWVERQPAVFPSRAVSIIIGDPAVSILMQDHGHHERKNHIGQGVKELDHESEYRNLNPVG